MIYLPKARLTLRAPKLNKFPRGKLRSGSEREGRTVLGVTRRTTTPRKKSISRGPGKHWLTKPAVIILSGGRERCNPGTPEGRFEYEWRRVCMFIRQWNSELDLVLCCVCRMPITLKESTWEHEFGRHASRIDERLWNPETQKLQNGLSHLWCNSQRGSRHTEIFHGNNCLIETERGAQQ